MQGSALPLLVSWQNFYMIMGAAAATLMGLTFVAAILISSIESHVTTLNAGNSAYNTPTIVLFGSVLVLAGIMSVPLIAYIALVIAALMPPANLALGLYVFGAATIALLFLGIHNAWDLVIFLAIERSHTENK